MATPWEDLIRAALTEDDPPVDTVWMHRAARYLAWVDRFAESHDLTGLRDPERRVRVFVIYPLRMVHRLRPFGLEERRGMDIGTGGGVPGIGMLIAGWRGPFWLVERSTRKATLLAEWLPALLPEEIRTRVEVIARDARTLRLHRDDRTYWCISQGVNWTARPLRRWIERRIEWGVPMVWVTTPRRATLRLAGRTPDRVLDIDTGYALLCWNV